MHLFLLFINFSHQNIFTFLFFPQLGLDRKSLESFVKRGLEIKKFVRTRVNEASDLAKVL